MYISSFLVEPISVRIGRVANGAPVGSYLASTTQKTAAADRNNVYTTAGCGVLLHCRYVGRARSRQSLSDRLLSQDLEGDGRRLGR